MREESMAATTNPQPALSVEPVLLRDDDGAIARLTLNRPDARNPLSLEMIGALQAELDTIAADRSLKVVVLAAGGPIFCAGHDLKELRANPTTEFYRETLQACSRMMQTIVHSPKPVIARVHGTATAGGCQLVASCDLAIAADEARFATPGVNIGLFCSTPMVALSRNVSRKRAMEMLLTGEEIDAHTAVEFGLINRAVPTAELDEAVDALAGKIASKSSVPVAIGKEAFYRQLELELHDAYDYASEAMVRNMLAEDAEEGIDAFLGKREPVWRER
jgi:enoyl-CoA hydratase/carnithine racemase